MKAAGIGIPISMDAAINSAAPSAVSSASGNGASFGASMGGSIMAIGQAVSGMIASGMQYEAAKSQMESQLNMAMAQYAHQDKTAQMASEDQLDRLSGEVQRQEIIKEGSATYNKAVEERKKAEDGLKVATAAVTEAKKTSKTGQIDGKLVERLFGRTSYSLGKPLHT